MPVEGVIFMLSEFERLQKKRAFNYSRLRFETMDDFLNEKTRIFRDDYNKYSYIFITIANFISYKEDIWVKNKKTKNISTNFSKEILDKFFFEGKFKSTKIDFRETKKQRIHSFEPLKINSILEGKEKDSIWIIDNIRDSIAHGHYYINFDNNTIVINNTHQDRLLNCEATFELFTCLNELITEERIGGYTEKKLTTIPCLLLTQRIDEPKVTNIKDKNQLRYLLKNRYIVSYCQVTDIRETNDDKKYNDLANFFNYNVRTIEEMYKKFNTATLVDIAKYYVKKMDSYSKDQMQNYSITIFNDYLDDNTIDKIINYIDEQPSFYTREIINQNFILHEIIKSVVSHEKITIERGIVDIVELYNTNNLKQGITNTKQIQELSDLIFSNANSFRENKKLANLFILGTNNFVSNKESIYDQYFDDYSEFDLSNFDYQDYSAYNKLMGKLKVKNNDLSNLNKSLNTAIISRNKAYNNLAHAPNEKKQIIQNNIDRLNILINELNDKISTLTLEISEIISEINTHKTNDNGNYINNNNKSFFNHLRNAFAHGNIRYLDDRLVYNRKIVLEDWDDDKNLSFRCVCRYYDLVKLFNNPLFIEAINNMEKEKRKQQ